MFQNNLFSGILISVGLLVHSRISFSLMVLACIAANLLNAFTGTYPEGISYMQQQSPQPEHWLTV